MGLKMFRLLTRGGAFVLLSLVFAWIFGILRVVIVAASGGSHEECGRTDCGALGGWSWENPIVLVIVYLLLGAGVTFMLLRSWLWPGRARKSP